mmetsp:Transcript_30877/g.35157  ORF Transcript_30877/g.35157 Transcript_30877/m.35157 type:complete len:82 (+) Transcript_30877:588-833(+)
MLVLTFLTLRAERPSVRTFLMFRSGHWKFFDTSFQALSGSYLKEINFKYLQDILTNSTNQVFFSGRILSLDEVYGVAKLLN